MRDHGAPDLATLLRLRAEQNGDQLACVFLQDGDDETTRATYAEIDLRASAVAAVLGELAPGSRALLVFPSGLDYVAAFFGCLYAGIIAVPAYPPPANRPMGRLATIAADAGASVVLTTSALRGGIEAAPELAALRCIAIDSIESAAADARRPVKPETIAFLQYTSGSTSAPRGVAVTHANIVHNQRILIASDPYPHRFGVSWLPIHHDMGLIGMLLRPIWEGFPVAIMPPAAFIQQPLRWLRAMSHYAATGTGGPNFAYDLCVDRISPEQIETLDLSEWRTAYNGSEPVREETIRRFVNAFAPAGLRPDVLRPCYGLAEATLMVSCVRTGDLRSATLDGRVLASCGSTYEDTEIAIVDANGVRGADGEVGEIWVRGATVAAGYWNNAAENERTFEARLASGEGPWLRTGDIGLLREGELYVAGRVKDLIIIDGRNHYPQDIEVSVERCHPAFRGGIASAFPVEVAGRERLVVAAEVGRTERALRPLLRGESDAVPPEAIEILRSVRSEVAREHDVRVHALVLVRPGSIPRTSSGKRQRHLCRARYLDGSLGVVIG